MAGSIGSVYYDVLPDLDGFAAKVTAGLSGINAKPIKIKVEADDSSLGKVGANAQKAANQTATAAQRGADRRAAAVERGVQREIKAADRAAAAATRASQRSADQAERAQQRVALASEKAAQQEIRAAERARATQKAARGAALNTIGNQALIAGAAVGVGVGLAVKASADFESAMSSVASTGSYTSGQLDLLAKAAVVNGQATKYSATEAAEGEAELVKAGLSVQQVLGGGLTGALNLAAAGNLSVADSASAAATAINQFGLQGSDATHVADRFVQIAGIAQGETSDVAEAFKNGAVTARQYGLSIDDASDVLGAFAQNGLTGAQAGTLLKSSLTNLYAPTGNVQKALDKLGVSAYDAAGNALPVADVAEQLKTRLAGLDEEAKNNALARIFGKETLQGGAILAAQGADGLRKIREQLDQFPTAAQTAATKMDNLKGDVEQLSGALETGLIKSGSGANGFLRGLAQGATDAVNSFTNLPGAVQKGALGVAGVGAAGLLAAGGIIKVGVAAKEGYEAFKTLSGASPALGSALGKVGTGAAIAVGALIALRVAGEATNAVLAKSNNSNLNPQTLGDAGQAIAGLGSAAAGAVPSLDKFFTVSTTADIFGRTDVDSLAGAFDRLGKQGGIGKASDAITGFLGKVSGVQSGADIITERFGQLDQTLTQMGVTSAPQAAAGFSKIAEAAAKQQVPVEKLVDLFPQYKAQLQDQATALGVTVPDSAQVYADWMGGKVPDAILAAAKANPQLAASQDAVKTAFDSGTETLATARTALENLVKPQQLSGDAAKALTADLFGSGQAALSASQAQIAYAQAVKQAKASTGGGINVNTDKGASNLSLLNQQASAYQAVATAQINAGKSASSVAAGAQKARDSFIANAEAMGVSEGKAKSLATQYGLLDGKKVKVKIEEEYQRNAASELDKLKALDGTVITPKIQALIDQGKYKQALGAVKDLQKSRRAKVTADAKTSGAEAKLKNAAKTRAAALKAQATNIGAASGSLDKAARKRNARIAVQALVGGAEAAINNAARNRSSTITVRQQIIRDSQFANPARGGTMTSAGAVGQGPKFSVGGSAWGAGSATSDSIAAFLSNGEEVTRTKQANLNRGILKRINAGGVWDIIPKRTRRSPSADPTGSESTRSGGSGGAPITINIDLGRELGGIRTIVADEINNSGEYAATLTRMGSR